MAIINQVVAGSGGGGQNPVIPFHVANGTVSQPQTNPDFTGITQIKGSYTFYWQYNNNTDITTPPDLSHITRIDGLNVMEKMYSGCSNMAGALDMSSVEVITGGSACNSTFLNTKITSVDLRNLVTIGAVGTGDAACSNMFAQISTLIDININSLETISGGSGALGFIRSTGVSNVYLPSLKLLATGSCMNTFCQSCSSLQTMWFYALNENSFTGGTSVMNNMIKSDTGVTIHFPKILDPQNGSIAISSLTTYPDFGGTNTVLLFDIVTSLTGADGNTYTRSEKNSTSTATAWTYNDTLYYTSGVSNHTAGVNEPSVSDAIYSDDACTQSVTTITAIA